jgi:hypothetical protein
VLLTITGRRPAGHRRGELVSGSKRLGGQPNRVPRDRVREHAHGGRSDHAQDGERAEREFLAQVHLPITLVVPG